MSNIGGLSGSTSSSLSGLRGYGGLASGLDRDSLIDSMTAGTQTKIDKKYQAKTKLEWEQETLRSISDKMIDFAQKYLETMTSGTNIFSSSFWGKNKITALGANSKYVSVSGIGDAASMLSITSIKSLASNATASTKGKASVQKIQTGAIDVNGTYGVSNLAGKTVSFRLGEDTYSVVLPSDKDYSDAQKVAEALNEQLAKTEIKMEGTTGESKQTLGDMIEFTTETKLVDGENQSFLTVRIREGGNEGKNTVYLSGGSALPYLGFSGEGEKWEETPVNPGSSQDGALTAKNGVNLTKELTFEEVMAGNSITFTLNGVTKTIQLPKIPEDSEGEGPHPPYDSLENFQKELQKQIDKSFGENRVKVGTAEGSLTFEVSDESSVFEITSAGKGILGEDGVFGFSAGTSNRLNLKETVGKCGLVNELTFDQTETKGDKERKYTTIHINDTEIKVYEDESMNDVLSRINSSDAGIKVTYQNVSDKFLIESTAGGAGGSIKMDENAMLLFGGTKGQSEGKNEALENSGFAFTAGKDAELTIRQGNGEEVTIRRGSNSFSMDGMTITLNGTFGADGDAEPITFRAEADTDKIVETVKTMVEEYNEIVELVNKEVGTKPNRDYQPLTSAQKNEMSEDDIERWEKKAKEGLMFNDSDLRSLSEDLRFIIPTSMYSVYKEIGLGVSTSYGDNGKLEFNEDVFRAALEEDPEKVKKLFTGQTQDDGTTAVGVGMKQVFDKYVRTLGATKGILIERAGSVKSPASITDNAIYRELESLDKIIDKLNDQLATEQDRYIRQFTTLETVIAQMNSQSSWLSQFSM